MTILFKLNYSTNVSLYKGEGFGIGASQEFIDEIHQGMSKILTENDVWHVELSNGDILSLSASELSEWISNQSIKYQQQLKKCEEIKPPADSEEFKKLRRLNEAMIDVQVAFIKAKKSEKAANGR